MDRPMLSARRPLVRTGGVLALLLAALVLGSSIPAAVGERPTTVGPAPAVGASPRTSSVAPPPDVRRPPPLGFGNALASAVPRPAQSETWYTQEGATFAQLNDSSATGMKRISEYVKLVNSPYSTGYELNGLTNSGDWWQIVVGDNWPGCNSGFEEVTEVWNDAQGSGPVNCTSTVSLSLGDLVEFTLYFSSGDGCLELDDITSGHSTTDCQTQPDSGGTSWIFLGQNANSNGYYTGPMTETVNLTATSCPDYTHLPRLDYLYANGTYITAYTPWSDEFDYQTSTMCYASSESEQAIGPGVPQSFYVDTAAGTGYGPRWADGQNFSMVDPAYGFRFETDPKPMTSVTLNATPTTPPAGSVVNLTATILGGVAPYRALWSLNGVLQGFVNQTWNWTAGGPGVYHLAAYGFDKQSDVDGPSSTVTITVPGPLAVSGVTADPAAGDDVGFEAAFNVTVSGGFGYYVVTWSGLPAGCNPANATGVSCAPTAAGATNLSVSVRDANGSVVDSGSLAYVVFPKLAASIGANRSAVDVGQGVAFQADVSGGSGGYVYAWSLPSVCSGRGPTVDCQPTLAGNLIVFLNVSDSVGAWFAPSGGVVEVHGPLGADLATALVPADVGFPFHLSVDVTGGTAPFAYVWAGLPAGCVPVGPVANCTLGSSGDSTVSVAVRDSLGETADSNVATVEGSAAPAVVLSVGASPAAIGALVNFTATTSGGSGAFVYTWSGLPTGCPGDTSNEVSCVVTSTGNFSIAVTATDSVGDAAHASQPFAVNAGPAPPSMGTALPLGLLELGLIGIAILGVVVAIALYWARRRG
ncbi:MAG: hypothetical protein L3K16_05125 [Thermoplasmata archaeon]|nr:hypothetical protein [Thermoplasmata archaeon]